MKIIIITSILLLSSCSLSSSDTESSTKVTNWHTYNARNVSKIVDGDVTCYSHSHGGIVCFKDSITK